MFSRQAFFEYHFQNYVIFSTKTAEKIASKSYISLSMNIILEWNPNPPISCGNSWQNTATEVPMPIGRLMEKAAAMAKPSTKLCRLSPMITRTATGDQPPEKRNGFNRSNGQVE